MAKKVKPKVVKTVVDSAPGRNIADILLLQAKVNSLSARKGVDKRVSVSTAHGRRNINILSSQGILIENLESGVSSDRAYEILQGMLTELEND